MFFLYFVRDEPLVALGRTVNDRTVLIALSMVTLVLLLRTRATSDVLISLLAGLRMVLIHAALRRTEDLVLKEEAAGSETWYTAVPRYLHLLGRVCSLTSSPTSACFLLSCVNIDVHTISEGVKSIINTGRADDFIFPAI